MFGNGSQISGSSYLERGLAGVVSLVDPMAVLGGRLLAAGMLRRLRVNFRRADFCKDIGTIGFYEPSRQIGKFESHSLMFSVVSAIWICSTIEEALVGAILCRLSSSST